MPEASIGVTKEVKEKFERTRARIRYDLGLIKDQAEALDVFLNFFNTNYATFKKRVEEQRKKQ